MHIAARVEQARVTYKVTLIITFQVNLVVSSSRLKILFPACARNFAQKTSIAPITEDILSIILDELKPGLDNPRQCFHSFPFMVIIPGPPVIGIKAFSSC